MSETVSPKRILLVQLKRIGDVILLHPVLTALRAKFPESRLSIAIDQNAAGIRGCLAADDVYVFRKGIRGIGFFSAIAAGGFDVCLDFSGNDRSALVTRMSRAPRRITYQRFAGLPMREWVYTEFVASSVRDRHTVDHFMDLAAALGELAPVTKPISVPSPGAAEAASVLHMSGLKGRYCVIHAGSARPEKYWVPERWAMVIDHFESNLGIQCVLTGADNPTEAAHLRAIIRALRLYKAKPINLAGKLSLAGTAAVIRDANWVCAVDSAPVHLADQLGTPVLALFGPTHPFHWRPRGKMAVSLNAAGTNRFSASDKRQSMEALSAGRVIAEIDRWVPSTDPGRSDGSV